MSFKIIKLRRSGKRFQSTKEWLNSKHTFSFGIYQDKLWNNFGAIKVINEDLISAGSGFPMHSHKNMEIITIVTQGVITHRDSLNNISRVSANEVQIMTAGKGISHSEQNEEDFDCKLLQIWVRPNEDNLEPSYKQISFNATVDFQLIIAPEAVANRILGINQNIFLWRCQHQSEGKIYLPNTIKKYNWIQIIKGSMVLLDNNKKTKLKMYEGDGVGFYLENIDGIEIREVKKVEYILFSFESLSD